MVRQEYGREYRPGISQFDSQCTVWDYGKGGTRNVLIFALLGTLPGMYTHNMNARDYDVVFHQTYRTTYSKINEQQKL